ncbi:ABC transporter permease [Dongia sedimenti]|uniref:ABC transporter permease n=1 Tax=Dongia sedimenti TaxID=3064282 RepID=A0ABU0YNN4_9PROT|nr:ABC transporter permease [Rhodospirillaceae bacterium R-7]
MSLRFLAGKVLRALLTLWLAVTFVFIVLRMSGDPVQRLLPDDAPLSVIEAYRARWGLDRSLPEQYVTYLRSVAAGDLGISFRDDRPAIDVVMERVPATLRLGFAALAVTLLIGLPFGVLAALARGTLLDRGTMAFTILGHSLPSFFLGILLILTFSMYLRVLPSSGSATWLHLIMPALTLGTGAAGAIARFTRSSMLEVLNRPFMRTARAKGASPLRRIVGHALPNAAIPVITVLGLRVGALIGGAVVVEPVFGWPGVGNLLVGAVAQRDLAVVQTIVLMVAFTMAAINFAVDLTYGWLNPRVNMLGQGTT